MCGLWVVIQRAADDGVAGADGGCGFCGRPKRCNDCDGEGGGSR